LSTPYVTVHTHVYSSVNSVQTIILTSDMKILAFVSGKQGQYNYVL